MTFSKSQNSTKFAIAFTFIASLMASSALADNLILRPSAIATGTEIKVGDIFENAGNKADVIIARAPLTRNKVVYSANALQSKLKSIGVKWDNADKVNQVVIWGRDAYKENDAYTPSNTLSEVNLTRNDGNNFGTQGTTEVAMLNRDINRDVTITPDMLVWKQVNSATSYGVLENAEDLIGKVAKRNLKANTPLRKTDLSANKMVKRGENITLIYQYGAMRITATGKALSDGGKGDTVKVANSTSNKIISAVVEDNGVASVSGISAPTNNANLAPNLYGSVY